MIWINPLFEHFDYFFHCSIKIKSINVDK